MPEHKVKLLKKDFITHNVKSFIVEKPRDYEFKPGQATLVSINQGDWREKKNPFTFTSINNDLVLEFTIKEYPERQGVTQKIHSLKTNDELIIRKPFGTINYKGKGVFIAGGAGITPFIAIFRHLREEGVLEGNKLFFSNNKAEDVILEKELKSMFGEDNLSLVLTKEKKAGYKKSWIDEKFLKEKIDNFNQKFYVCGPPKFVSSIAEGLKNLGADTESIVKEGD